MAIKRLQTLSLTHPTGMALGHGLAVLAVVLGCLGGVKSQQLVMSRRRLGDISLCERLDAVNRVFRHVKDTVLQGQDTGRWRAKLVHHGGGLLTFESSWSDSLRIWRITATSAEVRTANGYHVGSTFAELRAAGEAMTLTLPEGGLAVVFDSEGVGATFDEASEQDFYRRYTDFKTPPQLDMVGADARVAALFIGQDCSQGSR